MEHTLDSASRPEEDWIYALDIGTRSVIGMLGRVENEKVQILAVEKQPHEKRAMLDGQIEDIAQVARGVEQVTRRLEERMGRKLTCACVAAAGRALRTENGHGVLELALPQAVQQSQIGQLEASAVADAEEALHEKGEEDRRLFLVGYTVTQRRIDGYPMTSLLGHTGQRLEADVVATFLPSEVIDSLYAVMRQAGLEVASLTLEPIAALNAAIPAELRLLNLALVDIGAGTSDIAICREGSVVGYTMATVAGDEITEALMREYLVDFATAERMKVELGEGKSVTFTDILGLEQTCTVAQVLEATAQASDALVQEVAQQIRRLNGGPPSALFLAGGGSKLAGLREKMAQALGMDAKRVALAGAHFKAGACSDAVQLEDPEYTTPLGIAVSAGLGLISDSYRVYLNGKPAKLFRNGQLTLLELLMMNGYGHRDLLGRTGTSVMLTVDGKRMVFPGEPGAPAQMQVNGAPAKLTSIIHAGDQIHFVPARAGDNRKVSVREVLEKASVPELFRDGAALAPDQEVRAGETLESRRSRAPERGEPPQAEKEPSSAQRERVHRFQLNGGWIRLPEKPDGSPYYLMDLLEPSGIDFKNLDRAVRLRVNGQSCTFQQVLQQGDRVEIRYEEEKER